MRAENIVSAFRHDEFEDLFISVSIDLQAISHEVIRAYNYCQEHDALSIKLDASKLILDREVLNVSVSTQPVEAILAYEGELDVEIEVQKDGRTTLLLTCEQYKEVGYMVLFDGFNPYDADLGCQTVKFSHYFTTDLKAFAAKHLIKTDGDCVIAGDHKQEVLAQMIAMAQDTLSVNDMRELLDEAMSELASGLTVAEAVHETLLSNGVEMIDFKQ